MVMLSAMGGASFEDVLGVEDTRRLGTRKRAAKRAIREEGTVDTLKRAERTALANPWEDGACTSGCASIAQRSDCQRML